MALIVIAKMIGIRSEFSSKIWGILIVSNPAGLMCGVSLISPWRDEKPFVKSFQVFYYIFQRKRRSVVSLVGAGRYAGQLVGGERRGESRCKEGEPSGTVHHGFKIEKKRRFAITQKRGRGQVEMRSPAPASLGWEAKKGIAYNLAYNLIDSPKFGTRLR